MNNNELQKELIAKINEAANHINNQSRFGVGNYMIVTKEMYEWYELFKKEKNILQRKEKLERILSNIKSKSDGL